MKKMGEAWAHLKAEGKRPGQVDGEAKQGVEGC